MAKIPDFQTWTQFSSSFPAKVVPSKPSYSSDGSQTPSSLTSLPGDIKVKRISDYSWFSSNAANINTSDDSMICHNYAHKQVFNSDNTKLIFGGGWNKHAILNANGEYLFTATQGWEDLVWANTDPNVLYGRSTDGSDYTKLLKITLNYSTGSTSISTVIDMPYDISIGKSEGDISNDDTKIVLTSNNGGSLRLDHVDIANGTSQSFTLPRNYSECDWAMVSPLGNYVVVAYNSGVRDVDVYAWGSSSKIRRITYQQHADLGLDQNGDECIVLTGHTEGTNGTSVDKYRLSDNQKTVLFGGGAGSGEFPNSSSQPSLDGHVSCSASRWGVPIAYVSAYSSSGGPHVLFGVKMDGSREVCYYGFHNSDVSEYRDQPHFNTDRTGKIGVFKSNWGNSSNHTETYLAWDDSTDGAPVLTDPADVTMDAGTSQTFQLAATDPQSDPITYAISGGDETWISCDTSGQVVVTPGVDISGIFNISFIATDGTNTSSTQTVQFTIIEADTGTSTGFQVFTVDPDASNVIAGIGQTWAESTAETGYTGTNVLKATAGFSSPHDNTTGYIDVDLSILPPGNWRPYIRLYGLDTSADSFWGVVSGETQDKDQPIYTKGVFTWQHLADTNDLAVDKLVTNTDTLRLYPREQNACVDRIVFVEEAELSSPSGKKGFVFQSASGSAPVLDQPTDITTQGGQSGSFQLSGNDADGDTLSYYISGTTENWITCSSSGLVEYDIPQSTDGTFNASFIANDSSSYSNIVTVQFTVSPYDPYSFSVDISGGQQTFSTGRTITHLGERTTGGVNPNMHWNPGPVFAVAKDGSETDAYAVMRSAINNNKNRTHGNGDYVYTNFMISLLWKWGEPGDQNYSSGGAWAFIDECLGLLNAGQTLGIYWIDRRFNASDISKTPIPSDLRGYPNSYFYPSGETLATANLSRTNVVDRKVLLLKETGRRYNDNPKVTFITTGETSIHLPNGNVTLRDGSTGDENEGFFEGLKYLVSESKKYLSNIVLLTEMNFIGTFDSRNAMDLFRELCDHKAQVGGCGISLPDALACRHPAEYTTRCCDTAGSYRIEAYNLMTEYQGVLVIAPHAQTWSMDHERFGEDFDMMGDSAGAYSWHSHYPIFWPDGFSSRCSKYTNTNEFNGSVLNFEPIVRAEIIANPTAFSTTAPSSLGGFVGSTTGDNPTLVNAAFTGSDLKLTALSSATILSTDFFTVVFSDDSDNDQVISITFYDSDPDNTDEDDGTITSEDIVFFKPDSSDVVSQGSPNWIESTIRSGYSYNHHMIAANGSNIGGSTDCDYILIDLTELLPATGTYKMYSRVSAIDGSSDSWWADVNGEGMTQDQPIYNSDGNFNWQPFKNTSDVTQERTVSASDGVIKYYPREIDAAIDSIVFVADAETQLPTGKKGFVQYVWPGNTVITPPEDQLITLTQGMTQRFKLEIDPSINSYGVQFSVIDALDTVVSYVNVTNSELITDNGVDYYSVDFVGDSPGDCRIQMKFNDGADPLLELFSEFSVSVIDQSTLVWPEGASATLPETLSVIKGTEFGINAYPQNIKPYSLDPDRWDVSNSNVTIKESEEGWAIFNAETIGETVITYTMARDNDTSDPVVYTVNLEITAPQTINPDDFTIKNTETGAEIDVLENDTQIRITHFTQPSSGYLFPNADDTLLLYNPVDTFTGTVTFNYTADDGSGGGIDTSTGTIQVVDPGSFEGSVKFHIGVERYAVRGNTVPFNGVVYENPENYDMTWLYTFTPPAGVSGEWKNGANDIPNPKLIITSGDFILSEVIGSVTAVITQA